MNACTTCQTQPTVRRVQTTILGSTPVDLAMCECDFLRCPRAGCRGSLRNVATNVHRCPHCHASL